jgi:multidrug efflux pump subunit AcrB
LLDFLSVIIAWYEAGRIDLTWRPSIPGNRVDAEIDMPVDASVKQTSATVSKVEAAGLQAIENLGGKDYLKSWFTRSGWRRANYGDVNMYLVPDEQRPFTQEEFLREWRRVLGDVPEAKSIFFEYMVGPGGNKEFSINLSHVDTQILESSARELAERIGELEGVTDVNDGIGQGKSQWVFNLSP